MSPVVPPGRSACGQRDQDPFLCTHPMHWTDPPKIIRISLKHVVPSGFHFPRGSGEAFPAGPVPCQSPNGCPPGAEGLLRRCLRSVEAEFDLTVLDCPPSLGLLTVNALTAAEALLIPTPPQAVDLQGLRLFWETVERIRLGPFAGSGIRPPARPPRRPPETAGRPAGRPLPFAPPASAEPSASVPQAPAAPNGQRRQKDAYQDSPT
jgi:hypothetical protein